LNTALHKIFNIVFLNHKIWIKNMNFM
jgi:hypothetical protein